MRSLALLVLALLFARPAAAQPPPHAWLFGAWTGGLFPPPVTLNARECLAQPTVIFTRDSVLRMSLTDPAYVQRLIETVRATAHGAEFRFIAAAPAGRGAFDLSPQVAPAQAGFGCGDPNVLHVQRRRENEISFPHCPAFPFPLIRCPAR